MTKNQSGVEDTSEQAHRQRCRAEHEPQYQPAALQVASNDFKVASRWGTRIDVDALR